MDSSPPLRNLVAMTPTIRTIVGDCRDTLAQIPSGSIDCCVTSPPYWGQRDYGHDQQIGSEPSPEEFVESLVSVFRQVRRVLKPTGTLWLNINNGYFQSGGARSYGSSDNAVGRGDAPSHRRVVPPGHRPKNLIGMPWRVAFALQADGWWLRSDIIWSKTNPMPESVTDRPTKAHEHVFMFSASERYLYDDAAIAEPASGRAPGNKGAGKKTAALHRGDEHHRTGAGLERVGPAVEARNARDVWQFAVEPHRGEHAAIMPWRLAERCVLAGTSAGGACEQCGSPRVRATITDIEQRSHDRWVASCRCGMDAVPCVVLDPFGGTGTTGAVAVARGRSAVVCELNPAYAAEIDERVRWVCSMMHNGRAPEPTVPEQARFSW